MSAPTAGGESPVPLLFVAGTPLGSWLDAAAALDQAHARTDRYRHWLDDAVGIGARALKRQAAWAGGKTLVLTEDQRSALAGVVPHDGLAWVGADARTGWVLDALAAAFPGARFLLLLDHPARALAGWLAQREGDDPGAALQVWNAGARRLLQHAHRHRDRCLLLDADEARRAPAALLQACGDFAGAATGAVETAPVAAAVDPLAWALAEALIAPDLDTQALYEELGAASTPLTPAGPDAPSLRWRSTLDAAAAVQRWRALADAQLRAVEQQRQLEQVKDELAHCFGELEASRKLAAEQAEHLTHTQARADSQARLAEEARADADRHQLQLRQVKDELAHCFGELEASRKLAAEQAEHLTHTQARADSQARLAKQGAAQADRLRQQLAEQTKQAGGLSQDLDLAQAELRALDGSRSHALAALVQFGVARVAFGPERTQAPHRQLDVALGRLRCGRRQYERIDVRLLQHHGHAGLLIFAPAGVPPPVAAWSESGREGQRGYLLLTPAEAASQQRLAHLGTTDWGLVVGITARLVRELRLADEGLRARWLAVAQSLEAQLHHLPDRFRYDTLRAGVDAGAAAHPLLLCFDKVHAGGRSWPQCRLHWWPGNAPATDGQRSSVVLLAPEDAGTPAWLDAWPIGDDGRPAARLALPLGAEGDREAQQRAWARFAAHDRELLLSLFDALPAAARVVPDADLPAGLSREALQSAAHRLVRAARASIVGSPARRLARLLRARLRH